MPVKFGRTKQSPDYDAAVLREAKGAWSVSCVKCPAVAPLSAAALDDARKAADLLGWMSQARKGVGMVKWTWLCPSCLPKKVGNGFGLSTTRFMPTIK